MSTTEFALPDVGEGLADAEIVTWLVDEGGPLVYMEPMVEVETAKSVVEIPSPVTGTMVRHGAQEGESINVGATLAVLSDDTPGPDSDAKQVAAPTPLQSESQARPAVSLVRRVPAAPTVRRRAAQLEISLEEITGTGPGGRVLNSDLDAAVTATANATTRQPEETLGDHVEKLSRMRSTIGATLSDAWAQVPLITDLREVDAVALVSARALLREELESRVTFTTLFASVIVSALRRYPDFNASLDLSANTITYHSAINLGIAVEVPHGLTVGVVRDAGTLSMRELGDQIADVATAAREGRLEPERSSGATITISSFGKFGGWYGTPLVVPPQVAIAGFGPIKDKVVPFEGAPAIRATLPLSISADHRLIDGSELSKFSSHVERMIADPIRMLGT
ncbi:MAG: 2-oxo acid dehydrogenase subunit E2 [Microbacteriaceae bacterium]|nr:MAG: 2-oxo acid dehydrogenase subunit E2 [Microbacteriaceae bacterium]